jgi:hypothetical protein
MLDREKYSEDQWNEIESALKAGIPPETVDRLFVPELSWMQMKERRMALQIGFSVDEIQKYLPNGLQHDCMHQRRFLMEHLKLHGYPLDLVFDILPEHLDPRQMKERRIAVAIDLIPYQTVIDCLDDGLDEMQMMEYRIALNQGLSPEIIKECLGRKHYKQMDEIRQILIANLKSDSTMEPEKIKALLHDGLDADQMRQRRLAYEQGMPYELIEMALPDEASDFVMAYRRMTWDKIKERFSSDNYQVVLELLDRMFPLDIREEVARGRFTVLENTDLDMDIVSREIHEGMSENEIEVAVGLMRSGLIPSEYHNRDDKEGLEDDPMGKHDGSFSLKAGK